MNRITPAVGFLFYVMGKGEEPAMLNSNNSESGPMRTAVGMLGATALAVLVFMSIIGIFIAVWPAEIESNVSAVRFRASDSGPEWRPWGVQVAGSFKESRALTIYRGLH